MAREVTWAESASDDLVELACQLHRERFRGRIVPEFRDPSIRQLLGRDYRLVYEVGDRTAHVLRISQIFCHRQSGEPQADY